MTTEGPWLTLEEVETLAKAAGLRLTAAQLLKLQGELRELLPRLRRLESAQLDEVEPDWVGPRAEGEKNDSRVSH